MSMHTETVAEEPAVDSKQNRSKGVKFTEKYAVETATIYKGDPGAEVLRIPGPDHPLYDKTSPLTFHEGRVREIDSYGKMTDAVEVWSDPDKGILWVTDGRSRLLDVREVNRRRASEGREPVKLYLVPFSGSEKEAVARVRVKNYMRRVPTYSDRATDLLALRRAGWSWAECAEKLDVKTDDAEAWGRKLLPLAYCIPEVQEVINVENLPLSVAKKFGGTDPDGTDRLGDDEQSELCQAMLAKKVKDAAEGPRKRQAVPTAARKRVLAQIEHGIATSELAAEARNVARIGAAFLRWADGDKKALSAWPEVAALAEEGLQKPVKEKKAKESAA